jgi:hypothetical protein
MSLFLNVKLTTIPSVDKDFGLGQRAELLDV